MTPTLVGRIQTRLFLLATVGLGWTILISPILVQQDGSVGRVYAITISAVFLTAVFGVGWELLYHALQQYRWEKDWPILYSLVVAFPEGFLVWISVLVIFFGSPPPFLVFWFHFLSTWSLVWLVAVGPIKVLLPRWRYQGGRIVEK